VTDYIAYSPGHEKLVTHGVYKYSHGFNVPKITHFRTNYNSLIFKKLQSFPSVKKIKRVMINGSIIGGYYPMNTEYHAFAFLHCELKIVKVLRDAGYYVLYKPRPKSYHEVARIFRKYADEVLGGKFEDVYQSADCLLFVSHYSTTFGFSLLTNKPIVLLNVKGYTWYPRVFELTKKRCSVVEANPVDGRIVFDEQDVLNAVQESVNNINYDILHEFAF
jgi:hypothetical protein